MRRTDEATKARLTTWLVDQRRLGVECPEIMSTTIDEAERRRPLSVHERADRLLEFLGNCGDFVGDEIPAEKPGSFREMLAWSESLHDEEVEFLLDYLNQRGFIEKLDIGDDASEIKVTVDGHVRLAELQTRDINSKHAFIAMWFDDTMREAYEKGIAAGIENAGYQPVRIDGREHNNKIDDEIIAEIRRSRFLVADFTQGDTGARGGVYYEAGFAHGLNIPVIFTCQEDALGKVHFDTRQYNHIVWKTPEDLRERLAQRISATIGDGPWKTNS